MDEGEEEGEGAGGGVAEADGGWLTGAEQAASRRMPARARARARRIGRA
jgi:hypothetical protein